MVFGLVNGGAYPALGEGEEGYCRRVRSLLELRFKKRKKLIEGESAYHFLVASKRKDEIK